MRLVGLTVLLGVFAGVQRTEAQITINSLQVENQGAPIGIDVSPRFSWKLVSNARSVTQTSYRLTVSATSAGKSDVWDSGVVTSSTPYLAPYAGPALSSDTQYFWSVAVVSSAGSASAQSTFITGFLSQNDWGSSTWIGKNAPALPQRPLPPLSAASWIWNDPGAASGTNPGTAAFRRAFPISSKTPVSAQIVTTGDDQFTLWANGVQVGTSGNAADVWKSASTISVPLGAGTTTAPVTVNGTNVLVLAATATNGGTSSNPAGFLLTGFIVYSDGTNETIVTDGAWKAFGGSLPSDWQAPTFNDGSWAAASALGKYGISPWNSDVSVPDPLGEHPAPLLRKRFVLSGTRGGKRISQARVFYAAGGFAAIQLNGKPISDHVLTPAFTKYDTRLQYVAVDVKNLLNAGSNANAFGVELGRSRYGITQRTAWAWEHAPWWGEPVFRMVLSVIYTDGTRERVVSDGSWKNIEGPTRLDDLYGGENYDASYEISGWNTPAFDDSKWRDVLVGTAPKGVLVNARQPPTKVVGKLLPIKITQPVPGQYVASFDYMVVGWIKLTVTGPKGSLVTIHYGEQLKPDGTVVYEDNLHYFSNNFQTDRYWLAGRRSAEVFEPKFSYKGFQYIQISGWPSSSPPKPSDITAQLVNDDLAVAGEFTSSVDLVNKLHAATVRTLLNNAHGIPTDTPVWEKNGWAGDAQLGAEMFLFNFDSQEFLAKYTQDLLDTLPVGRPGPPGVIAPSGGWGADNQADPWHAAFIFIPAWIYSYRGDTRILSDNYEGMKSYIEFELGRSPNNIANTGLGDWVAPESSPFGGNPTEDSRVSATAYLYRMLDIMAGIARTLGKTDDANLFASQAAGVKTAFNDAFWANDHYAGVGDNGYRQTHNLLALAFNLTTSQSNAQAVADSVAADVNSRGGHLNTGALGTKHILPMLTAHGHSDVAAGLIKQTTYPSWGFWIQNGATTCWEHWAVEARSHDHFFLGTYDDWFYQSVLGIQPTSTAYKTVSVAPAFTAAIPSASGWVMTPYGKLSVSYNTKGQSLSMQIVVPVGVSATVSFSKATTLTESGTAVAQAKGVTTVSGDKVQVGSGSYSFVAQ
ncbi:hypothetical protein MIND_01260000 [Mycena indigotica]|uniref:alpha-L-rhamnosidase n=1 Tax=Mycena indigotica TaxID=2126181 RepID=A0A8H6VV22_9AGAR|nr:uncharacterized protein MIND_01260000 [Mycena indigotica]KAF7291168.1 hypothetical protein MIND_01260000 [Mycena indigotica]